MRNLALLGSTGSIGRQTLEVVREHGDKVRVVALGAYANAGLLATQVAEFVPDVAVLQDEHASWDGPDGVTMLRGEPGAVEVAHRDDVDLLVVATSGRGGLLPTLAALRAGKRVALANKEALVMAGNVIRDELAAGGELVPIDSEHSAIWQCLLGEPQRSTECLTLTASGGALRHLPAEALIHVTPEQALQHPTWSMGKKITVDSANLMNKGLEVIEARWLFDVTLDRIQVVLHPQSVVHSLVQFEDSSVKAQLGYPDMRLPIQYALSHPDRWPSSLARLDLASVGELTFGEIDLGRYPALRLALDAGRAGGTYPAVLSAADEVAVGAFLAGRVSFTAIPEVIAGALEAHRSCPSPTLDDILEADTWARAVSERLVSAQS